MNVKRASTINYDILKSSLILFSQFYSILDMSEGLIFLHVDDLGGLASILTSLMSSAIWSNHFQFHGLHILSFLQ